MVWIKAFKSGKLAGGQRLGVLCWETKQGQTYCYIKAKNLVSCEKNWTMQWFESQILSLSNESEFCFPGVVQIDVFRAVSFIKSNVIAICCNRQVFENSAARINFFNYTCFYSILTIPLFYGKYLGQFLYTYLKNQQPRICLVFVLFAMWYGLQTVINADIPRIYKAFDSMQHKLLCNELKTKFQFSQTSITLISNYISSTCTSMLMLTVCFLLCNCMYTDDVQLYVDI